MSETAKLIERLRNVRRLDPGGVDLLPEPICREAASRLSALQEENDRLRAENDQLKCAASILSRS
jgi:hypothetical protein